MNRYHYSFWHQLWDGGVYKLPVSSIKNCLRLAEQHQLSVSRAELVAHHFAGGNIQELVDALVYAKQNQLELSLMRAAAQDLASTVADPQHQTLPLRKWARYFHEKGILDLNSAPLNEEIARRTKSTNKIEKCVDE
jgi:hypothetical protein